MRCGIVEHIIVKPVAEKKTVSFASSGRGIARETLMFMVEFGLVFVYRIISIWLPSRLVVGGTIVQSFLNMYL